MNEQTTEFYDAIRDLEVSEICPSEENLFLNYGREKRKKRDERSVISFAVDQNTYDKIKKLAKENDASMSMYCQQAALNAEFLRNDPALIRAFNVLENICEGIISYLKALHLHWEREGNVQIKDLNRIEEFTLYIEKRLKSAQEESNKILRKQSPEETIVSISEEGDGV